MEHTQIIQTELAAVVKVTAWAIASTAYARFASSSINPGKLRLLALLPLVILFNCLPHCFASVNLRTISSIALTWLPVFKFLLLAFGVGPLSPSLPLSTFIAATFLPVKSTAQRPRFRCDLLPRFLFFSSFHLLLLVLLGFLCESLHPSLRPLAIPPCMALLIELCLGFAELPGLPLQPYYDAPYKSTSLQDFWGHRWNLVFSDVLRPSVYAPVKSRFGTTAAFLATFLVSGIVHEVYFYHITLQPPTGEVTLYFVVHGVCTALEVKAKKAGWWRLQEHPVVAVPLTLGFVLCSALWLTFPPLVRGGWIDEGLREYTAAARLVIGMSGRKFVT